MRSKLLPLFLLVLLWGCSAKQDNAPYDTNVEVPKGDPPFKACPNWILDDANVVEPTTEMRVNAALKRLQDDGVAEVVIIIMNKVSNDPATYATHYGRWLKLGKRGLSTEGGNDGFVWLIRPDAQLKMTYSAGRGFPMFTEVDIGAIMDSAKEYINFNNYDEGVITLARLTDKRLRELSER